MEVITTGKQLAESIFGWDVVAKDWAGYEHGIELRTGDSVVGFVGLTTRIVQFEEYPRVVAGIGFVCVQDDWRNQGIATNLMKVAHFKAKANKIDWALLNAGYPDIYKRLGYYHADNLPAGWYVCELGDDKWPDPAVDLRGTW